MTTQPAPSTPPADDLQAKLKAAQDQLAQTKLELDKAKELGAKDWLIKTEFDPQEVVDKVVNQIGK